MTPRIGIVGLLLESNTFIGEMTRRSHFESDLLLRGGEVSEAMRSAPHEVGGFYEELERSGAEIVPVFLARALPYGRIERETFESLVEELLAGVAAAGPLDGILAAPHGATVAEGYPDADGYWLGRLRDLVGPELPVMTSLDPHGNLSPAMVAAANAIVSYRSNPHLDQRETGVRAARLLLRTLRGEVRPVQVAAFPPMAINIRVQNTSEEPMRSLFGEAAEIAGRAGILDYSILFGFPYADVAEMGSSVLVIADGDRELARETATAIARRMWQRRAEFDPIQIDVNEAVSLTKQRTDHPVVLLDMGDNVGGGSPADGTAIALESLRQGAGRTFVCLHDPKAVASAVAAGEGGRFEAEIGDRNAPIRGRFRVRSLCDGVFHESQARHGGFSRFDQGRTAVLELEGSGLVAMVTTLRMAPFSLSQLTTHGVAPEEFDLIVAKGVIAPMAAYAPIAMGGFIHVDTPGVTRADMTKLTYDHRRRPMFPFEKETEWSFC